MHGDATDQGCAERDTAQLISAKNSSAHDPEDDGLFCFEASSCMIAIKKH
jgi:hypothetical protein